MIGRKRLLQILRKPPRIILWKLHQRTLRQLRRFGYWRGLVRESRSRLRAIPIEELRRRLRDMPQLVIPDQIPAAACRVAELFPAQAEAIIAEADRILRLEFSYLGWTRRFEQLPLPWTSDWGTGRNWAEDYYADYDYAEPGKPSDVKSCWEPSRFHFGLRLGAAYALTGDTRYRTHFFALLRDWRSTNPVAYSINWTSPLEVAIRGANLATALAFFSDAHDEDYRILVEMLAEHGAFLYRNIEYTDVRGNHYTGDLFGLLTLGLLLEAVFPPAVEWRQYAESRLAPEILLQFHADGVNFEKSIPYHRFVSELFMLCALLAARAGRPLPDDAVERLRLAVEFTAAYLRPDGHAPIIGDNDNARALPLAAIDLRDHTHLIAVDSLLRDVPVPLSPDRPAWAEAMWLSGGRPPRHLLPIRSSRAFPDGGFYVARFNEHYLILDAGTVGLQSGGCHGHHDMLSFELALRRIPLIVDSGSPAYTGDVAAKNRFRKTAAHNTAVVDSVDQGAFDPALLWHLGADARPRDVEWYAGTDHAVIQAAHSGYARLQSPVIHHRKAELHADGRFQGTDTFSGDDTHTVELFFHLDPGVSATELTECRCLLTAQGQQWEFAWDGRDIQADLLEGEVSPSYGSRISATTLRLSHTGPMPWHCTYRITPT